MRLIFDLFFSTLNYNLDINNTLAVYAIAA